jgi:hypothetical protein
MIAAIFAWGYAILIFALASEVQSEWLKITGIIFAVWMAIAGSLAGYQRFR